MTEAGLEIARATYKRHQTFQSLLENLGVDGKTAAADACLMERQPGKLRGLKGTGKKKEGGRLRSASKTTTAVVHRVEGLVLP